MRILQIPGTSTKERPPPGGARSRPGRRELTMHTLPFGKHEGEPLPAVPTDYLAWLIGNAKLRGGRRAAAAADLRPRGQAVPSPPPPKPPPTCHRCGGGVLRYYWSEFRNGTRQIRRACARRGAWLGHAPKRSPFVEMADAAGSQTALLDVLVLAEGEGVALRSAGLAVG